MILNWFKWSFLNHYNFSCTGTSCLKLVQYDILKGILFWGVINKAGAWFFRGVLKEQTILNNLLTSHSPTHHYFLLTSPFFSSIFFYYFFFFFSFLLVLTILYLNTFFLIFFNFEHTWILGITNYWSEADMRKINLFEKNKLVCTSSRQLVPVQEILLWIKINWTSSKLQHI